MELSPVFTPIHQSHKKLVSPAQFWRTSKISYILLYCLQHDIENITLNTDCSFEICVAEDAHVFIFQRFLLSTNYDLRKMSIHAVTHRGFELKVFFFILAYGIEKAMI